MKRRVFLAMGVVLLAACSPAEQSSEQKKPLKEVRLAVHK